MKKSFKLFTAVALATSLLIGFTNVALASDSVETNTEVECSTSSSGYGQSDCTAKAEASAKTTFRKDGTPVKTVTEYPNAGLDAQTTFVFGSTIASGLAAIIAKRKLA